MGNGLHLGAGLRKQARSAAVKRVVSAHGAGNRAGAQTAFEDVRRQSGLVISALTGLETATRGAGKVVQRRRQDDWQRKAS